MAPASQKGYRSRRVAPQRVFSSAKKLLIPERNRLTEDIIEIHEFEDVVEERCHATLSLLRNPPIRPFWTREGMITLSSVKSLYDYRAEVIITHTPSTSDAYKTHARPVEKSITSPAL